MLKRNKESDTETRQRRQTEIMPDMHKSISMYNDTKRQDGGGVVSEQEAEGRKVSVFLYTMRKEAKKDIKESDDWTATVDMFTHNSMEVICISCTETRNSLYLSKFKVGVGSGRREKIEKRKKVSTSEMIGQLLRVKMLIITHSITC